MGHGQEVFKELLRLKDKRIPGRYRAKVANLAWRVDFADLGLGLLHRTVRHVTETASTEEIAEYAQCLILAGADEEALELLSTLNATEPKVLLYKASALISRWRHVEAIPLLKEYLSSDKLPQYQRTVGELNLVACFIVLKNWGKARLHLGRLIHNTSLRRYGLLHASALNLSMQLLALQGKCDEMERVAAKAAELVAFRVPWNALITRKWAAFGKLIKTKGSKESLVQLSRVRREAESTGNWETVRQCDRFRAVCTQNDNLFIHLIFGTHDERLRQEMLTEYPHPVTLPDRYVWKLNAPGNHEHTLDLFSTEGKTFAAQFPPGSTPYRCLATLVSDFYRPFRVAELFRSLYPDEQFNPFSSSSRVHSTVYRITKWTKSRGLPITIHEENGKYRLIANQPCAIYVPREAKEVRKENYTLSQLRNEFTGKAFSADEASRHLQVSRSSVLRLLQTASAEGRVVSSGRSRAMKYRFCA